MNTTKTLKATLTADQTTTWESADWGVNSRQDNQRVAQTVITMLAEGINTDLIWDDRDHLMDIIEERSGVSEVSNRECRETVLWVLDWAESGIVVWMEPDAPWHEGE